MDNKEIKIDEIKIDILQAVFHKYFIKYFIIFHSVFQVV